MSTNGRGHEETQFSNLTYVWSIPLRYSYNLVGIMAFGVVVRHCVFPRLHVRSLDALVGPYGMRAPSRFEFVVFQERKGTPL